MLLDGKVYLGKAGEQKVFINPAMANRHGLVAGATGTGKTVTLKVMAEAFSDAGIPVFLEDTKGDLAGMCQPGADSADMQERISRFGLAEDGFGFKAYPTTLWDVYGQRGIPLRTTVSEMGPLLLSQILGLNDNQQEILTVVFRIADDEGMLLIDSKDLRSMLQYVSEKSSEYSLKYGNIAKQSLGAIQRAVMALEAQGSEQFLGEPALNITDWLCTDTSGRGMIHVLDAQKLILNPQMYSTFVLWMLSELYETLPEAGDLPKPKMIFFFDEAHLLFDMASPALLQKIEQVVKLVRSKGVGVYFCTQNPADIPDGVLAQLGNKIQHALHAYTPAEKKKLHAAAQSFRENPAFSTEEVLEQLGIGEALVSVLDENGVPSMVEKVSILPPQSHMGAIDDMTRDTAVKGTLLYAKYAQAVDNDSAYEFLQRREVALQEQAAAEAAAEQRDKEAQAAAKAEAKEKAAKEKALHTQVNRVGSTVAGTVGREVGNTLGSAVGGKFGKRLGGNLGAALGRGILNTLFKR